jgi:hypothetical protein
LWPSLGYLGWVLIAVCSLAAFRIVSARQGGLKMPIFIASVAWWSSMLPGHVAGRVLVAMGLTLFSYTGVDTVLGKLKADAILRSWVCPLIWLRCSAYMKVGVCISIIASAVAVRMGFSGLGGVVKRLRRCDMLHLITGANGAGKTLNTLKWVRERSLKENRPVCHNGRFEPVPVVSCRAGKNDFKDWQKEPDGTIFLIDECHNDLPVRSSGAAVPEEVRMLAEHRRRGMDFYLVTQHPQNVDNFVRRLVGSRAGIVT